jgi:hypothetical protein
MMAMHEVNRNPPKGIINLDRVGIWEIFEERLVEVQMVCSDIRIG